MNLHQVSRDAREAYDRVRANFEAGPRPYFADILPPYSTAFDVLGRALLAADFSCVGAGQARLPELQWSAGSTHQDSWTNDARDAWGSASRCVR
jgi:hypothetical protein